MQKEHLKYFMQVNLERGEGEVSDMQETSKKDMQEEHLKYFIKSTNGGRGLGVEDKKRKREDLYVKKFWKGICNVTALKRAVRHKDTLVTVLKSDGSSLYF